MWRRMLLVALLVEVVACAASGAKGGTGPEVAKAPSQPASTRELPASNTPWWQGAQPACVGGLYKTRNLSWGSVYWCEIPGQATDAHLQNDLGRLARCINESIGAFQEEPEEGKLGEFLARAHEAGLNPVLCSAVRRDVEPRTYHGRSIVVERREEAGPAAEEGTVMVRYRFGCEDCLVAAETIVQVAK